MQKKNLKKFLFVTFLLIILFTGCSKDKGPNPVLNYVQNSELTYDNKTQRDNIFMAMKDIVALSSKDLEKMRYQDDMGKENQWDLKQVFNRHFKPKKQGLEWGDNFYEDVKDPQVQAIAAHILVTY
jgi:hypothetical protein